MEQPFFSHDKLILFDLVNFAPKQPNPTDSQRRAEQFMNSYLTPKNIVLGVVYLRNSRAHAPDKVDSGRLDSPLSLMARGLSRNLLRPELIIASLGSFFIRQTSRGNGLQ